MEDHFYLKQIKTLSKFNKLLERGARVSINNIVSVKDSKIYVAYLYTVDFTMERLNEILYALYRTSVQEMINKKVG